MCVSGKAFWQGWSCNRRKTRQDEDAKLPWSCWKWNRWEARRPSLQLWIKIMGLEFKFSKGISRWPSCDVLLEWMAELSCVISASTCTLVGESVGLSGEIKSSEPGMWTPGWTTCMRCCHKVPGYGEGPTNPYVQSSYQENRQQHQWGWQRAGKGGPGDHTWSAIGDQEVGENNFPTFGSCHIMS